MAQATPYTFTERKRIRKSFGKRASVLNVPYLLTMQRDSYVAFLQKDVPASKRKPEGLQAAFLSAFPINSHNGFVEMKFLEYNMAKPAFDVRECQQRGLTFAAALRSFLRQDPDTIMVGEIRDLETAQIAVQASLTGHVVLSTLHTNDAPGAVTRLIDMGLEPFLISASLEGVLAQRLVALQHP